MAKIDQIPMAPYNFIWKMYEIFSYLLQTSRGGKSGLCFLCFELVIDQDELWSSLVKFYDSKLYNRPTSVRPIYIYTENFWNIFLSPRNFSGGKFGSSLELALNKSKRRSSHQYNTIAGMATIDEVPWVMILYGK